MQLNDREYSVNHYVLDVGGGGAEPELNAARLEIGWGF